MNKTKFKQAYRLYRMAQREYNKSGNDTLLNHYFNVDVKCIAQDVYSTYRGYSEKNNGCPLNRWFYNR